MAANALPPCDTGFTAARPSWKAFGPARKSRGRYGWALDSVLQFRASARSALRYQAVRFCTSPCGTFLSVVGLSAMGVYAPITAAVNCCSIALGQIEGLS